MALENNIKTIIRQNQPQINHLKGAYYWIKVGVVYFSPAAPTPGVLESMPRRMTRLVTSSFVFLMSSATL